MGLLRRRTMTKDWASESTGDTGGFADRDEHDAALRSGEASAWEQPDPPQLPEAYKEAYKKKKTIKKKKKKKTRIEDLYFMRCKKHKVKYPCPICKK